MHAHTLAAFAESRRSRLVLWLTLWSERCALAQLDDVRLADLGVSPHQAKVEASRPFWDVPKARR